jgi:hypothetical protein
MKHAELGLLEGFFLCLRDSEAIRAQSSGWKRNMLIFSSGVCMEIAALPVLAAVFGYDFGWLLQLVTVLFFPLGAVGFYASKYGNDTFVERLLVMPKLDLRI